MSRRNLGNNYALSWSTGNGTHLTLLYFENVKRGYEQSRVKQLAKEFLTNLQVPEYYKWKLDKTKLYSKRCVLVDDRYLTMLQEDMFKFFTSRKFTLRELKPLHIDLRGQAFESIDQDGVYTCKWHY